MRLIPGLLLAFLGSAAASPTLPAKLPKVSAAAVAKREAEFRKRNTQAWSTVEVDQRGFIKHAVTDDPALVPNVSSANHIATWPAADDAKLRDFLRANADLFGIDAADVDRLPPGGSHLLLVDTIGGAILGEINIQYLAFPNRPPRLDITVMFRVHAKPKLTEDDVAKRVIGAKYADTVGYAEPPHRDCAMTPLGGAGCKMPILHTIHQDVTIAKPDVRVVTWLWNDNDTLRLVTCIDAADVGAPPADPAWGKDVGAAEHALVPQGHAPQLPLVVDAVTGDTIATHVKNCYDPAFGDAR